MHGVLLEPDSLEITHPTCERCGAPMWLTRIEPDRPHHERRTFECKACGKMVVEWLSEDK